jgi:succinate dehydrogenase / fumarate reductase cytochrome b subunit
MAQATIPRGPVTGTANAKRKKRPFLLDLYGTGLGKKYVMAVTGIIGLGYVFAHMVGNLKMYLGPAEINAYADFLRALLVPILPRTVTLWLLRSVLVAALVLHVHAAYSLTVMNRRARSIRYQSQRDYVAANFASRTMRWTGIIVALFLVWHLADLTWGWVNPDYVRGDAYDNLVASFERVPVSIFYILANLALGLHLFHGGWSMFQSMGVNSPQYNGARRGFAAGFAGLITLVNISFPIMVLAGVVH